MVTELRRETATEKNLSWQIRFTTFNRRLRKTRIMFTLPAVIISPVWSVEISADPYRLEIRNQTSRPRPSVYTSRSHRALSQGYTTPLAETADAQRKSRRCRAAAANKTLWSEWVRATDRMVKENVKVTEPPLTFTARNPLELSRVFVSSIHKK